ncbi:MAG: hydantoinase/oxoprolinase family protein [Candidatus Caldarchaeum sp.]
MAKVVAAVDVGGTFTDLVAVDEITGRLYKVKTRSTPQRPEEGFLDAVKKLLENFSPNDFELIIHVNTIGTNLFRGQLALKMPAVSLVTTKGFRDVVEIGRQNRPELYNIFYRRPEPIVPRERRFEVSERVDGKGVVLKEVDERELESLAEEMEKIGTESVAICFLNSYLNPVNEKRAKEVLSRRLKALIFTSYEVDPEYREYERTSTTVVNAALAPVVSRYIASVRQGLDGLGVTCPVQIMSSAGGLVDVDEAVNRPVACIESGPAAGVIGAAKVAEAIGLKRVISFDMGGTTAKAGVVVDGLPATVPEMEVGGRVHMGRIIKGSGYPVRFPSIDLAEVSAGGGTIIQVSKTGGLQVGPLSAGADPGPACYGMSGEEPTITDANHLLGRVEHLLGGEMKLNTVLAEKAMEKVAKQLGQTLVETSWSSLVLANLHMARAVHIVTLERGLDPTEFTLVAFGGAGPMHAAELAEQIGISKIVIPPSPGLFSSLGLLMTDMKYSYVKGYVKIISKDDEEKIEQTYREIEAYAVSQLSRKVALKDYRIVRTIDLRYLGQGYEIEVGAPHPFKLEEVFTKFEELHSSTYGYKHVGEKIESTALRVYVIIPTRRQTLPKTYNQRGNAAKSVRRVFFRDGFMESPVLWRESLETGYEAEGPLVIEEYDSTTVVPPDWRIHVEDNGCMVMKR